MPSRPGVAPSGYLDQLGTSVTPAKSLRESDWLALFDFHLKREMRDVVRRLRLAVVEHVDPETGEVRELRSPWHQHRADTIEIPAAERLDLCGERFRAVECGCRVLTLRVGCGAKWCAGCQRQRFAPVRRRLKRAMDAHEKAKWSAGGRRKWSRRRWRWVLLTLTVAHSGDLQADRASIVRGWKRLRQWVWKRIGQFPFALVWECTDGEDGLGHLHAHVAALWPWLDWSEVHREWCRATDGRSNHISIESTRKGANGAAKYLAKYATKGVVVGELSPEVAAKFVRATYNQRTVYASEKFWRELDGCCTTCGGEWETVERPDALRGVQIRRACRATYGQIRLPWGLAP